MHRCWASLSHSCFLMLSFFFFFSLLLFFFPGRIVRAKRIVEAANAKEYEYMEGSIPMEWDGKSGQ